MTGPGKPVPNIWLFLFAAFCLLPPAGFIAYKLASPSDGARLGSEIDIYTEKGAIISPYAGRDNGLHDGDVVTAVDGIPLETWGRAVFSGGAASPDWGFGGAVEYEVLRGEEKLLLQVPLGRFPLAEVLRTHWGALLYAFFSQVIAAFVLYKRREDPAARALFIWAFSGSHTYAWSFFLGVGDMTDPLAFWLFRASTPLLWLIYWPASTHVALVFPKPLRIIRRRPYLVPAVYGLSITIFIIAVMVSWVRTPNVLLWMNTWGPIDSLISALFIVLTLVFIVIQYRRRWRGIERQQIRWAVFGAVAAGGGGLVLWTAAPLVLGRSVIDANFLGLMALLFPVSLGIAIWRFRLFDIDILINRTLVYSSLTAVLAGLYFFSILILQNLFRALSGQESPLAIVLSTLAIAALFNPLRARMQRFIDQRYFRHKYDAERSLMAFAQTARDEVDLESLAVAILGVVDETVQPKKVGLWLKKVEERTSTFSKS